MMPDIQADAVLSLALTQAYCSWSQLFCHCIAGTGLLNGRSEELLGQFVKEFPGSDKQRRDICIATKLAPYPWRITSGMLAYSHMMHDHPCI